MNERRLEDRIVSAMAEKGYFARHIDCSIPGFPDILLAKDGKATFVEVKDWGRRGHALYSLFEAAQPVLFSSLEAAHCPVYLALGDPDAEVRLYRVDDVLRKILTGECIHLDDLGSGFRGTLEEAADELDWRHKGGWNGALRW